jgi:hypothetical protein
MPKFKITASPKVGTLAFENEGDLVVLADGAEIDASAWVAAQLLDAIKHHLAKGRVHAEPVNDPLPAVAQAPVDESDT